MFILETAQSADVVKACQGLTSIVLIVKFLLTIIQWIVPIILIVLGTIDLVKAVIAGKEEDIKKNQTALIKRVIAAVVVFLVPMIVTILMGWIGNDDWKTCWNNTTTPNSLKSLFGIEDLDGGAPKTE